MPKGSKARQSRPKNTAKISARTRRTKTAQLYTIDDVTKAKVFPAPGVPGKEWRYLVKWQGEDANGKSWEPTFQPSDAFVSKDTLEIFWSSASTGDREHEDLSAWDVDEEVCGTSIRTNTELEEEEDDPQIQYSPPDDPNPKATKVYARFDNGCYYPAKVGRAVGDNKWRILFDDGDVRDLALDDLRKGPACKGEVVSVSRDDVVIKDIEEDGTFVVEQRGKAKDFPIPEEDIERFWGERKFDNKSLIDCLPPNFLNSSNPSGLDYEEFVRGTHLGVFPSYYEPWGYTPADCTVMGSITTNLSGFGHKPRGATLSTGAHIRSRTRCGSSRMNESMSRRQRINQRNRVERLSPLLDCMNPGIEYSKSRQLALQRAYPDAFPATEDEVEDYFGAGERQGWMAPSVPASPRFRRTATPGDMVTLMELWALTHDADVATGDERPLRVQPVASMNKKEDLYPFPLVMKGTFRSLSEHDLEKADTVLSQVETNGKVNGH
ncbi:glycogen synthase-domain-containing protein [Mycena maculata]|uniref:Glycogen [starch] synthase n=1 Tax=Mycena maculata TaxID=230809 RepID=A0AAD7I7Y8_9AGAR|nr:glycogen synthase-domain-containing protein [Mycena maculata]